MMTAKWLLEVFEDCEIRGDAYDLARYGTQEQLRAALDAAKKKIYWLPVSKKRNTMTELKPLQPTGDAVMPKMTSEEETKLVRAIESAVISEIYFWGEQQIKNQTHSLAQEISKRTLQYLKGER